MTQATYLWTPPAPASVAVRGTDARFPVKRIFCVGRNYHAHAKELAATAGSGFDQGRLRFDWGLRRGGRA